MEWLAKCHTVHSIFTNQIHIFCLFLPSQEVWWWNHHGTALSPLHTGSAKGWCLGWTPTDQLAALVQQDPVDAEAMTRIHPRVELASPLLTSCTKWQQDRRALPRDKSKKQMSPTCHLSFLHAHLPIRGLEEAAISGKFPAVWCLCF